jgi:hypothetical protein
MSSKPQSAASPPNGGHLDRLLDEALDGTFPASDPVAIRFDPPPEKVVDRKEDET